MNRNRRRKFQTTFDKRLRIYMKYDELLYRDEVERTGQEILDEWDDFLWEELMSSMTPSYDPYSYRRAI
jgi:hypothetical protein